MSQQSHRKDRFPYWLKFKKKREPNTTHPYGPQWKRLSKRLKNAAGNVCTWCNSYRSICPYVALSVHHIDGNPYNNHRTNLIVLCNSCHRFCHSMMLQGADIYNQESAGQTFFIPTTPPEKPTQEVHHENP